MDIVTMSPHVAITLALVWALRSWLPKMWKAVPEGWRFLVPAFAGLVETFGAQLQGGGVDVKTALLQALMVAVTTSGVHSWAKDSKLPYGDRPE